MIPCESDWRFVGAQTEPAVTSPTSRSPVNFGPSRYRTSTFSVPVAAVLRAWKRKYGECAPTHIGALVTEPPSGISRDFAPSLAPVTAGALPATGAAPPVSDQPASEPSTFPPGAGT